MKKILLYSLLAASVYSCAPLEDADISLPAPPSTAMSVEFVPGDSNRLVIKDVSTGFFDRTWDLPGAIPVSSKLAVDTAFYPKKGDYIITLYTAADNKGGVSSTSKVITIPHDAQAQCDPFTALLTGNCEAPGKCWTFSTEAYAVSVGPTPGSSEWYHSPENGLVADQYDDKFCFYFDGSHFQYYNNGKTVNPWNGYVAEPFDPPTDLTWLVSKGTGDGGVDQLILPNGAFLGVRDSGPVYDIYELTENRLVVRSPILNSTAGGFFQLTFVKI